MESETKAEPTIDYPTVYIREREGMKLPELPKGEFYVVMKARVAGFRNPSDGEASIDLEVMKMSGAVDDDAAMALVKSSYPEEEEDDGKFSEASASKAFRESLDENQIGQSG